MRALTPLVGKFSETAFLRFTRIRHQSPALWAKLDKLSTERGGGSLSALFPRNESWTAFWKAMLVRADAVADVKKRDEARKAIVEQLASQNLLDSGT
ncbi:hypothetical protein ACYG9R_00575 [Mesorhizobium sp. RSR565B]|uniref:hypothetical protein n=1 Tax=unclassified Mesorhizobium TaxID=325217 RepID=UPI0003CF0DEA|nr:MULTISPECIES: hypothetical protein [unclassified Mesorhizobium]ESW82924.1 hypothetical protein X770_27490 [Mesorhizobium sp. LSJC269B00]ESZ46651.1 hypothetical protein X730_19865 [Mesorhizobium sp. L103C565B0]